MGTDSKLDILFPSSIFSALGPPPPSPTPMEESVVDDNEEGGGEEEEELSTLESIEAGLGLI